MKRTHIIILVAIAALIVTLIVFSAGDLSTYDSIGSAKNKQGKSVTIIAKLDRSEPLEYDAVNNPNFLSFYAIDSLGGKTKVIFRNSKPFYHPYTYWGISKVYPYIQNDQAAFYLSSRSFHSFPGR